MNQRHAVVAEFIGTGLLLAVVVGSGIMAERLSSGNAALALLGNSIATGAGLYVLITLLGPVSGAHFNPVVSAMFCGMGSLPAPQMFRFILAQVSGGLAGVWLTHAMFAAPIFQMSTKVRSGMGQWLSEIVATLVLLAVIHFGVKRVPEKVPLLVALAVTAGYWFTASTFFANPAVTIARSLSDTFAGIAPEHVTGFIAAQAVALALLLSIRRNVSQLCSTEAESGRE